ncbi:MAG: glycosyltransferase family 39 protein, partial [Anaerolineae bacterium]|nr:glycosyltransferase family 39 protein [Anaerolineae bacterium]
MYSHIKIKRLIRTPIFWLTILYLITGVAYAWVTPALEKPDEQDHYGYLLYLRKHHRIPPLAPEQKWLFESKQPPLYYVMAAILTGWLKEPLQIEQFTVPNPYMDFSVPGYRNDNRNVYLHPPYITPLIFGARLVSLLFGLGTMLTTYFLTKQIVRENALFPLVAAALVGFQPKFLYLATALNNDVAMTFFSTLVITILVYRVSNEDLPHFATSLGCALGLAIITKVSALVLFPLTIFALLLIHKGLRPSFFKDTLIVIAFSLLIGGWWYMRNAILYHDPFTLNAHLAHYHVARTFGKRLLVDLQSIEHTFWGNQARTFISPIWLDEMGMWWGRIGLILLCLELIRNFTFYLANKTIWILTSWALTFFILLLTYWTRRASWAYGRFLFPSLSPIMFFLLWGWYKIAPQSVRKPLLLSSTGTIVGISILIPWVSLYPLYHPSYMWTKPQVQYPTNIIYRKEAAGEAIVKFLGYSLPQPYAHPGEYTRVKLCWEPLNHTAVPYTEFLHLLEENENFSQPLKVWGRRQTYPGLGNRPTDRWKIQQIFCDTLLIKIDAAAPALTGAALEVGFVNPETGERLMPTTSQGETISLVTYKGLAIISESPSSQTDQTPHQYLLDNRIALNNLAFSRDAATLTITATWQCLQEISYNATVFVKIQNGEGEFISQLDRQPLDGRYPTSYWLPGQIITDVMKLPLPTESSPQKVNIGMYTLPIVQRLPIVEANSDQVTDNMITLPLSNL